MKKLMYFMGVFISLAFIVIACGKQDVVDPQSEDSMYKAKKDKISICHLDEYGNWITININQNALPAHLAHGDMINLLTPMVGTYTVNFYQDGSPTPTSQSKMIVTEVSDGTFMGYGYMTTQQGFEWDIVDGTYDENGFISLRVNYTGNASGNYLDIEGTFSCGDGYTGIASIKGGPYTSTWDATLDMD